ncbi:QRFP-like peptide receptor [Lytechinus variegatus]|uniref:QRFP-like peptide receptor n=1 Tax=Lytechinus variegatus TaxID=7654 RepID=UPI001BB255D2|nr:QRFP-like peptide receptor [Lytechinus variegatus]XP_041464527.1 QRFP-like peptide receptor [Lytechinus variegatus]
MNSLVLFVMARSPRGRKSSHNVYAASLAFSDLMVVLIECPMVYAQFLLPGDVSKIIFNPKTSWVCIMSFYFNSFFGTASIMTQLALNIDRYCMIIHPLTTRAFATPTNTRAGFILVLVWSISMIPHFGNIFLLKGVASESYEMHGGRSAYQVNFCISRKPSDNPYTPHVYTATVFTIFYLSTLVTTIGLYIKIVFSLRQRKPSPAAADDRIYSIYMRRDSVRVSRQKFHRAASRNILRIMGCSVLSYCFCYSIYFYINLYYIYFGFLRNNGFSLFVIANLMGAFNALVNPTLFACYSDEFKKMVFAKIGCCGPKSGNAQSLRSSYRNSSESVRRASVYQTSSNSSVVSTATSNNDVLPTRSQTRIHSESTTVTETEA